ncbi:MAG: glycosyltransferase family 2 protein [Chlorobiales bacterium]|nr:glycosyltransferase family 2 protein [Chlorobiales bacterium]
MTAPSSNTNTPEKPEFSVVIPAYNEGKGLVAAIKHIAGILDSCNTNWEIVIVDDGSKDNTYANICELAQFDSRIKGLSFSRNFGKEAAILAGLKASTGRAVITIDADLQHPPSLIPEMLEKWRSGTQIIHAVKQSRKTDSIGKKLSAYLINKLVSGMGKINIHNSSDFKLLDRAIVDIIVYDFPERERFYRGLSSWLGFREEFIYFDVQIRAEDKSKWSLFSLIELAITAMTSFTGIPLRFVTFLGGCTLLLSIVIGTDALWSWFRGEAVSGFATLIISLLLIGSVIMISLGIIGEYIAKIYEEVKARPRYLVKSSVGIANPLTLMNFEKRL